MNKLFTKIVGAALGLTMAIGLGVAVASNSEAVPVYAASYIEAVSLSISKNTSNSAYAKYYSVGNWKIPGNQALGDYVKMGGKFSSDTRYIASTTTISDNIAKVSVSTGTKDSAISVTSMKISAHETAAAASDGSNPTYTFNLTYAESSSSISATKTDSTNLSGKYWRFELAMTSSASSSNKGAIINGFTLYKEDSSTNTLSSIAVTTSPTKTTYYVGDSFDSTGMVVTASYSSGSPVEVTDKCTFSPATFTTIGNQNVTVSYTEGGVTETTTQAVTVNAARTITGVSITGDMTNKSYTSGDSWDYTGLYMTITYNVGEPDAVALATAVADSDIDFTPNPSAPTAGVTSLTLEDIVHVSFEGDIDDKTITGITVKATPSNFTWDLTVDSTSSASTSLIEWDNSYATMSGTAGSSTAANNYYPGTSGKSYTSTRFYSGATFTITPKSGVEITKVEMTATSTNYATAFGSSWTNATSLTSDTLITVIPTDGTTAFSQTVGGTAGFSAAKVYYYSKTLEEITWSGTPVSPQYVGDEFDYSGLTFTAVFSDSSTDSIAGSAITWNALVAGQNPTGSYNGETVTITGVSVVANVLSSIAISGDMTKTTYKAGGAWDPSGLIVTATFTKGPQIVTGDVEWSYSPSAPAANTKSVVATATYTSGGVTKTASTSEIAITIATIEGLLNSGYYYITATDTNTYYFPQGEYTAGGVSKNPAATTYDSDVFGAPYYFDLIEDNTYTVSFVNGSDKTCYLNVDNDNSGAKVTALDSITDKCKWKLDSAGSSTYHLSANDGTQTRYLALYNQQDWRTYKTTGSGVPQLSIVAENDKFASDFVGTYTASCNADVGSYTSLDWTKAKNHFNALNDSTEFVNATYTTSGSGSSTVVTPGEDVRTCIAQVVAKYDYIVLKYNSTTTTVFEEFMGRIDAGQISYSDRITSVMLGINNASNTYAIIGVISMISITCIGGYFFLRKRKEN